MTRTPLPRATALLRELHERAGAPSHRQLSTYTTSVSATTLRKVPRGEGDPRPNTVNAFISACLDYAKQHRKFARLSEEQWSLGYWRDCYNELNVPMQPAPSGEVNLRTGLPVRTRYREQVRRIAPARLVCRETELAELAAFCTAPDSAYAYWRAEPWAGKSALMSWFVLHPPTGVRIVSFFVTARLSSQNDRAAFIDNAVEQLVTLLGQDVSPFLTEATHEPYLLSLLSDAAEACHERGEQLVLLVDGLDEDRGVTISPEAHSIAALLPVHLPAGMCVIASGRPDPPVPWDVSDDHPLRDPAIARLLSPSRAGQAVRADMERELKRLLHGTDAEQDLLGVLTAAGGGLTTADLAALTGLSAWTVHDHLRAVTGRTFTRRDSDYRPRTEVYLLGHEELQATAHDVLGPERLAAYRQRVHTWAESHRDRGWPQDTPEFLLRNYYDLLTVTGDLDRMVTHAIDPARQDRLLDASGGDATALANIATAQDLVYARDPLNLTAMIRLAIHRERLRDRNSQIPADLPALWVTLGLPDHAESLALSITDTGSRISALIGLAEALGATGHQNRAIEALSEAAAVASTMAHRTGPPALYSRQVVDAWIEIGEIDRAEDLSRSIADASAQCAALAVVVAALVRAGELHHAAGTVAHVEALARATTNSAQNADTWRRRSTLISAAEAFFEVGKRDRAAELLAHAEALTTQNDEKLASTWVRLGELDRAETLARRAAASASVEQENRSAALASVAKEMAEAGELDRAETLIHAISHTDTQDRALQSLTTILVESGDIGRAETVAHTLTTPYRRCRALLTVATAMAMTGRLHSANELVNHVETEVGSIADSFYRGLILTSVASVLFAVEAADRANELLDEVETHASSPTRPYLLMSIATVLASAGKSDRATVMARRVEDAARSLRTHHDHRNMVHSLIRVLAATGDIDGANVLVHTLDSDEQQRAMKLVLFAMAKAGEIDRAEAIARSFPDPQCRNDSLASVATAMAEVGEFDRADTLAQTLINFNKQDAVLTPVVAALLAAGQRERATRLAVRISASIDTFDPPETRKTLLKTLVQAGELDCVEALVGGITNPYLRTDTLAWTAQTMAGTGAFTRGAALARRISDPNEQSKALTVVAQAAVNAGERDLAAELITLAESLARAHPTSEAFISVALALTTIGERDRASDMINEAEDLARSATDTLWPGSELVPIATALAEMGDFDRAEVVARTIPGSHARDDALESVACVMAKVRAFDCAEATTHHMTNPLHRDKVVTEIIELMVEAGDFDRAEALAHTLTDRWDRAVAIQQLAMSDAPRRVAATAQILMLRHWYHALDAVVRLQPGALNTILTELAIADQRS